MSSRLNEMSSRLDESKFNVDDYKSIYDSYTKEYLKTHLELLELLELLQNTPKESWNDNKYFISTNGASMWYDDGRNERYNDCNEKNVKELKKWCGIYQWGIQWHNILNTELIISDTINTVFTIQIDIKSDDIKNNIIDCLDKDIDVGKIDLTKFIKVSAFKIKCTYKLKPICDIVFTDNLSDILNKCNLPEGWMLNVYNRWKREILHYYINSWYIYDIEKYALETNDYV